jgi:hypothetical protein
MANQMFLTVRTEAQRSTSDRELHSSQEGLVLSSSSLALLAAVALDHSQDGIDDFDNRASKGCTVQFAAPFLLNLLLIQFNLKASILSNLKDIPPVVNIVPHEAAPGVSVHVATSDNASSC